MQTVFTTTPEPDQDSQGLPNSATWPKPEPAVVVPPVVTSQLGQPNGSNGGWWSSIKALYRENKWYIWAIVFGLLIVSVLAYLAFRPVNNEPSAQANVQITIDAPSAAPAGGELLYKIKTENLDRTTLTDLRMELVYPDGVQYLSSTPKSENLSGTEFRIPDLKPGQNAVVIVKTNLQGALSDNKLLQVNLKYKYQNFSTEFVATAKQETLVAAADVTLELSGPSDIGSSEVGKYQLYYRNGSDKAIDGARVEVKYPSGFRYGDSDPKPNLSQNIWNIGKLDPGMSGKISFSGQFDTARPGEVQDFGAELQVLGESGQYLPQSSAKISTTVSANPLSVSVTSNQVAEVVQPGANLNYRVKYRNNTRTVATGIIIELAINGGTIKPESIRADGAAVDGTTIAWTAGSKNQLAQINPGEEGELNFSFTVADLIGRDGSKNQTVTLSPKIKSKENSVFLPGTDTVLKVATIPSLQTAVAFVAPSSALVVGQEARMQVTVDVKNTSNDLSDAVLNAVLPTGVQFVAGSVVSAEANKVTVDAATGKLVWKLGTVAAHSGTFSSPRRLVFTVKLTPTAVQANQTLTVLRSIKLAGIDSFTKQSKEVTVNDIDTNSLPNGSEVGRVRQ